MRKALQRRPGFEALESKTLLSGLAGAAVSAAAPNPIHLSGSIRIEITRHAAEKGSGSIGPLGHVTASGNALSLVSLFTSGSESLTLTTKTGKVFVSVSLSPQTLVSNNGAAGEYTITGGTKAYAGEAGSGKVQITWPGPRNYTVTFS
jgi:hypothetical protein